MRTPRGSKEMKFLSSLPLSKAADRDNISRAYQTRWDFEQNAVTEAKHPHKSRNYIIPPFFQEDKESSLISQRSWARLEQCEKLDLQQRKMVFLFLSLLRRMLHDWPPEALWLGHGFGFSHTPKHNASGPATNSKESHGDRAAVPRHESSHRRVTNYLL